MPEVTLSAISSDAKCGKRALRRRSVPCAMSNSRVVRHCLPIDTKEGEVLVPLAAEFCVRIDVKAKRIDVTLPEGLRDLNRG